MEAGSRRLRPDGPPTPARGPEAGPPPPPPPSVSHDQAPGPVLGFVTNSFLLVKSKPGGRGRPRGLGPRRSQVGMTVRGRPREELHGRLVVKTQENNYLYFLPHSTYSLSHEVGLHHKRPTQQSLAVSFVGGPQVVGCGEGASSHASQSLAHSELYPLGAGERGALHTWCPTAACRTRPRSPTAPAHFIGGGAKPTRSPGHRVAELESDLAPPRLQAEPCPSGLKQS